ncbi:hypothetical protein I79_023483 [Cricetulus griseus]|uniref:Uncharacterized protein n=1 Tax=Cricetulus griseus TaxID=10029 RepID=G3II22_CRIGR|nr:hypothetical protein I79_023483 [Cricetulus griseus]
MENRNTRNWSAVLILSRAIVTQSCIQPHVFKVPPSLITVMLEHMTISGFVSPFLMYWL